MKKVILYLLGIIVLLVVGFLSIGFFVPVVEYTTNVEINKPREFTWTVLRERKDWVYGFKSLEQISAKPDEDENHAKFSVERDGHDYAFDNALMYITPPDLVHTKL